MTNKRRSLCKGCDDGVWRLRLTVA